MTYALSYAHGGSSPTLAFIAVRSTARLTANNDFVPPCSAKNFWHERLHSLQPISRDLTKVYLRIDGVDWIHIANRYCLS